MQIDAFISLYECKTNQEITFFFFKQICFDIILSVTRSLNKKPQQQKSKENGRKQQWPFGC